VPASKTDNKPVRIPVHFIDVPRFSTERPDRIGLIWISIRALPHVLAIEHVHPRTYAPRGVRGLTLNPSDFAASELTMESCLMASE